MIGALDASFTAQVEKDAGPATAKKSKDFFRTFLNQQSARMSDRFSEFMQRATKIACFCEAEDVPLLWAHYGDQHRGFCVEYPFEHLPRDDFRVHWLLPVVYSTERFNLIKMILRLGGKMNPFLPWLVAIHKSPDWAYEREWRIVAAVGDDSPGIEWTMPTPSRVILGHRMTPENRATLIETAREQGFPVFEMVPSSDGFKLDARMVPEVT